MFGFDVHASVELRDPELFCLNMASCFGNMLEDHYQS
jgi:hypothetical protein